MVFEVDVFQAYVESMICMVANKIQVHALCLNSANGSETEPWPQELRQDGIYSMLNVEKISWMVITNFHAHTQSTALEKSSSVIDS